MELIQMKKYIVLFLAVLMFSGCGEDNAMLEGEDTNGTIFKEVAGHPEKYFYYDGITDNKVWYKDNELTLSDEESAKILEILGTKLESLYKVTEYKKSNEAIGLDEDISFHLGDSSIRIFVDTIIMDRNGVEADAVLDEKDWKEIYAVLNKNAGLPEEEEKEYEYEFE